MGLMGRNLLSQALGLIGIQVKRKQLTVQTHKVDPYGGICDQPAHDQSHHALC